MSAIIIAKVAALLDRRLAVRILSVPLVKFVIVDRNNSFMCFQVKFRFGSLAALHCYFSSTAASGGKAVVQKTNYQNPKLNVCFHQKRSFKLCEIQRNEGQLTATSGHPRGMLDSHVSAYRLQKWYLGGIHWTYRFPHTKVINHTFL